MLLHGFTDTWRTWELVLPELESEHDVLALTLPGHAGGPPLAPQVSDHLMADALEREMDEAGFATAHLVGNSLGAYLALHLAARGRARSVVAFAPAGGWAAGDDSYRDLLGRQASMHAQAVRGAALAAAAMGTPEARRRATRLITVNFEHLPADLLAHQILGVARCDARPLIAYALAEGYRIDAEHIACPVRVVWGAEDQLLPWPSAAVRYRLDWLPHADWLVIDGVGHCPQLDAPLEAAELILGFTAG